MPRAMSWLAWVAIAAAAWVGLSLLISFGELVRDVEIIRLRMDSDSRRHGEQLDSIVSSLTQIAQLLER